MAFDCGFYNSVNHDRIYDAVQFGEMFDGLISDGVYATVGHAMTVAPVSGMTVKVRSGRAWFNKTWSVNTNDYPLDIPESDMLLPRIDAVVLEVDTRLAVRNNSLRIVKGFANANPNKPTLMRANGVYQYPLAWINVRANTTSINSGDIEIAVGRDPTPFVTGIVKSADISDFWEQWNTKFYEWFDEIRTSLGDGETGAIINMQAKVEEVKVELEKKLGSDNKSSVAQAQTGTNDSTFMTPAKTLNFYNYRKATLDEAKAGTVDTKYMTPYTAYEAFKDRKTTGHAFTTTAYGADRFVDPNSLKSWWAGTSSGYAQASSSEVSAGSNVDKYVPPDLMKTYVNSWINSAVSGLSNDLTVTKQISYSPTSGNGCTIETCTLQLGKYGKISQLYINAIFVSTTNQATIGFKIPSELYSALSGVAYYPFGFGMVSHEGAQTNFALLGMQSDVGNTGYITVKSPLVWVNGYRYVLDGYMICIGN